MNVIIIGATSTIAEHCGRNWAKRGAKLLLVARNQERLRTIAADLEVRGAASVFSIVMDLNEVNRHREIFQSANDLLDKPDVLLVAHGTLSQQTNCERDFDLTLQEVQTNALSVISLLTEAGNYFGSISKGTIAVISSVAGDRGRASNYIYGSSKAMINSFMSGLRQRLWKVGVTVLTIKPGFVDTPMTASFSKNFLWAKPNQVAAKMVRAIERKKQVIYVPSFWRWVMLVIKIIPERIYSRLSL